MLLLKSLIDPPLPKLAIFNSHFVQWETSVKQRELNILNSWNQLVLYDNNLSDESKLVYYKLSQWEHWDIDVITEIWKQTCV